MEKVEKTLGMLSSANKGDGRVIQPSLRPTIKNFAV